MVRLRLVTTVDTAAFGAYCQSFSDWKSAVEAFNRTAERDPDMHGHLIKGRDGEVRQNPLSRIVRATAETMLRAANEFALTPVARARLGSSYQPPAPPSKFDGLIAG